MVTVRKAIKFPLYVATMMRENNQKNVIIVRPLCELGRLSPPVKKNNIVPNTISPLNMHVLLV